MGNQMQAKRAPGPKRRGWMRLVVGALLLTLITSVLPSSRAEAAKAQDPLNDTTPHGEVYITQPYATEDSGKITGEPFKVDTGKQVKDRLVLILGVLPSPGTTGVASLVSMVDMIAGAGKQGVFVEPSYRRMTTKRSAYIYDANQRTWWGPVTFERRQIWVRTEVFFKGRLDSWVSGWVLFREEPSCHFYDDQAIKKAMTVAMASRAINTSYGRIADERWYNQCQGTQQSFWW